MQESVTSAPKAASSSTGQGSSTGSVVPASTAVSTSKEDEEYLHTLVDIELSDLDKIEDARLSGIVRRKWASSCCRGAGEGITGVFKQEERELKNLIAHGCSLISNIEVAAVNAGVEVQSEAEGSEETWRNAFGVTTLETDTNISNIEQHWERTLQLSVAQDIHQQLLQMKCKSDALLHQKRGLVKQLKDALTELDEKVTQETLCHRDKRNELSRRLHEHIQELHHAARDTVKNMQVRSDGEHSKLVEAYSAELEETVKQFNEEMEELMRSTVTEEERRRKEGIESQIFNKERSCGDTLKNMEEEWQKSKACIADFTVRRALEKPRLLYRLRLLRTLHSSTSLQLSEARRKLNCLRPKLMQHRNKVDSMKKDDSKSRSASLLLVKKEGLQLQTLRERLNIRRDSFNSTWRNFVKMHRQDVLDIIEKVRTTEQKIESLVFCRDYLAPPDECPDLAMKPLVPFVATNAGTLLRKTQGENQGALTFKSLHDDDKCFLLRVFEASSFLVNVTPLTAEGNTEPTAEGEDKEGEEAQTAGYAVDYGEKGETSKEEEDNYENKECSVSLQEEECVDVVQSKELAANEDDGDSAAGDSILSSLGSEDDSELLEADNEQKEDSILVKLEQVFKELDVRSNEDLDDLLSLARGHSNNKKQHKSKRLAITADVLHSTGSQESVPSLQTDFTLQETLHILTTFVKNRTKRRTRQQSYSESDSHHIASVTSEADKFEESVGEMTRKRDTTWSLADKVLTDYHSQLTVRKYRQVSVAELERQKLDLQKLLSHASHIE